MPRKKDFLPVIKLFEGGKAYQVFHLACFVCHKLSSSSLSRKASIHFQKLLCLYAISSPSLVRSSMGRSSHITSSISPSRYLNTLGERTKKPPLIHFPSPIGFSLKFFTMPWSEISIAPNLASGCTAVTVAILPCFL